MAISYNWWFQWDEKHSINGVFLVLITGITQAITVVMIRIHWNPRFPWGIPKSARFMTWMMDLGYPHDLGSPDFVKFQKDEKIGKKSSPTQIVKNTYHLVMTNSLPWQSPFLRTVNHLFVWAIEKPWQTVSHNQRVNIPDMEQMGYG